GGPPFDTAHHPDRPVARRRAERSGFRARRRGDCTGPAVHAHGSGRSGSDPRLRRADGALQLGSFSTMSAFPTLVLDLDGTLVDTVGDLVATLNAVLATEGLAPVPEAEGRTMVGHGARAMLSNALVAAGGAAESERL